MLKVQEIIFEEKKKENLKIKKKKLLTKHKIFCVNKSLTDYFHSP